MSKRRKKCNYTAHVILPVDQREGPEDKGHFIKEGVGWFHIWGTSFMEFEDGAVEITVAIVEDVETGQVYQSDPTEIRFINE